MLQGKAPSGYDFNADDFQLMRVSREIIKSNHDFELAFDDSLSNFTEFNQGERLAKKNGEDIVAEQTIEAVVFSECEG